MSAVNHGKHDSYLKRPEACQCPWASRQFSSFDMTVDVYLCKDCGTLIRVRSKDKPGLFG